MSTSPIILSNQVFVPASLLSAADLQRWRYEWEERITEEAVDEFGDFVVDEKDNRVLQTTMKTRVLKTYEWVYTTSKREDYIALPRGNYKKLDPFLKNGFIDLRVAPPFEFDLNLNENVFQDHRWPDQKTCVDDFVKAGSGIIKGQTGSGKTIIGMGVIAKLGLRTLILSKRRDGNDHWIKEIRQHTNISEIEEALGRPLIGVWKGNRKKNNNLWPITVATVQSFLSQRGRKRMVSELQHFFGLVMVDEVHEFGSPEFSRLLSYMSPKHFCGLTATIERTDNAHFLLYDLVGPLVAEAKANQMLPRVTFIETGCEAPGWIYSRKFPPYYQWNACLKYLSEDEDRYKLIIDWIHKDIEDNRTIACVSERRVFPKEIYKVLCEQGYNVAYVDGSTKKRDEIYEAVRAGKVQVLCAGKVLNALVNIPNLDCIHILTPLNKETAIKQIYGRGRRWMEGKRTPVVRDYVDTGGQLTGAYKNRLKVCKKENWDIRYVQFNGYKEAVGKMNYRKKSVKRN